MGEPVDLPLENLKNKVLESYGAWYTVSPPEEGACKWLFAAAEYHRQSEKYVLVKKAKLWGAENNDYAYFFAVAQADADMVRDCCDYAISDALTKIRPHSEHMSSDITAIVMANSFTLKAKRELEKRSFHKNFLLTLHGWCDLRAVALELDTGKTLANRKGKGAAQLLAQIQMNL
ncbi:MAG: hypothetical protein LBM18_04430 [Oscillospiraceae bacterium]|jgi:hypothetical protein|nr:hypothetical protein [Oscillospiraceae bacterium]